MPNHKKVFVVDSDLSKLEETFKSQRIEDVERFNIIESFITSFESVKEVVQLMSLSRIGDLERRGVFFKTVFSVDDDTFNQVTDKVEISQQEYYDKLLGTAPEVVERKLRMKFNFRGADYTLDFYPDLAFAVAEIECFDDAAELDWELFSFGSLLFEHDLNMSLDESAYRKFLERSL